MVEDGPGFQLRVHPLGSEHGWEMVGPDGEVWCRGDPSTRARMIGLLSVVSLSIQSAGAAVSWASGLTKEEPNASISRIS